MNASIIKYETILKKQKTFLYDFLELTRFKKVLVPFSGGMDSALCLSILKLLLKDDMKLLALFMPSIHTEPISYELVSSFCKKNSITLETFPIKFLHSTFKNQYKDYFREELLGVSDENLQARLRALISMAYANSHSFLVANCSNKSELLTGFSTLYGDSIGAFSLLGDLYKTEVYEMASFLNQKYDKMIDERILKRPPSAELKSGQKDTDRLPPYETLDPILKLLEKYEFSTEKALKEGTDSLTQELLDKAFKLYTISKYKRGQFCPICKL